MNVTLRFQRFARRFSSGTRRRSGGERAATSPAGRRRIGDLSALLIIASLCAPGIAAGQEAKWETYEATPADGFVDTVGVATHYHYFDTSYGEHDLLTLLDRLGVRHIRDAIVPQSMKFYSEFVEQAGPGAGVSYVLNEDKNASEEDQLRMVAEQAPGSASQIESDNEPDCDGWQGGEIESYYDLAHDVRELMDSLPELREVPLTTPSFCRTTEEHYSAYGDDGISERFNIHPYVAGRLPEEEIGRALGWVRDADPDAVPVVTEGGFHNAVNSDGGHKPTSMEAESAYLPQMFLEYQRQGVALTHTYELIDLRDNPAADYDQENFGLYKADGTLKPAGASLTALLTTLTDPEGAQLEAATVRLATEGGGDKLRVQPYTRSDGSVDVVMWMAQKIWDTSDYRDLPNETSDITVSVPTATEGSYVRIDGTEKPERQTLDGGAAFTVPVSAHPTILRLGLTGSVGPDDAAATQDDLTADDQPALGSSTRAPSGTGDEAVDHERHQIQPGQVRGEQLAQGGLGLRDEPPRRQPRANGQQPPARARLSGLPRGFLLGATSVISPPPCHQVLRCG